MVKENYGNMSCMDIQNICDRIINRSLELMGESVQFGDYKRAKDLLNEGYEAAFMKYQIIIGMRNLFLKRLESETQENKRKYLIEMRNIASSEVEMRKNQLELIGNLEKEINKSELEAQQ